MPRKSNSDYNKIREIAAHYAQSHKELHKHYPFLKNIYDHVCDAYYGENRWKKMIEDMELIESILVNK